MKVGRTPEDGNPGKGYEMINLKNLKLERNMGDLERVGVEWIKFFSTRNQTCSLYLWF